MEREFHDSRAMPSSCSRRNFLRVAALQMCTGHGITRTFRSDHVKDAPQPTAPYTSIEEWYDSPPMQQIYREIEEVGTLCKTRKIGTLERKMSSVLLNAASLAFPFPQRVSRAIQDASREFLAYALWWQRRHWEENAKYARPCESVLPGCVRADVALDDITRRTRLPFRVENNATMERLRRTSVVIQKEGNGMWHALASLLTSAGLIGVPVCRSDDAFQPTPLLQEFLIYLPPMGTNYVHYVERKDHAGIDVGGIGPRRHFSAPPDYPYVCHRSLSNGFCDSDPLLVNPRSPAAGTFVFRSFVRKGRLCSTMNLDTLTGSWTETKAPDSGIGVVLHFDPCAEHRPEQWLLRPVAMAMRGCEYRAASD